MHHYAKPSKASKYSYAAYFYRRTFEHPLLSLGMWSLGFIICMFLVTQSGAPVLEALKASTVFLLAYGAVGLFFRAIMTYILVKRCKRTEGTLKAYTPIDRKAIEAYNSYVNPIKKGSA